MASLATGFVLGVARLLLELGKSQQSGFLFWYADINFLHFAILLFVICTVVLVVVSLLTPPQDDEKLAGLTFATAALSARREGEPAVASDPAWRRKDFWLSILLVICVAMVWLYFRG
jgi:SSS family solute:Na+ symporter